METDLIKKGTNFASVLSFPSHIGWQNLFFSVPDWNNGQVENFGFLPHSLSLNFQKAGEKKLMFQGCETKNQTQAVDANLWGTGKCVSNFLSSSIRLPTSPSISRLFLNCEKRKLAKVFLHVHKIEIVVPGRISTCVFGWEAGCSMAVGRKKKQSDGAISHRSVGECAGGSGESYIDCHVRHMKDNVFFLPLSGKFSVTKVQIGTFNSGGSEGGKDGKTEADFPLKQKNPKSKLMAVEKENKTLHSTESCSLKVSDWKISPCSS